MDFKPSEFEKKWIDRWEKEKVYKAVDFDTRGKSYMLIEFPYPSGERLHVGHARSYCCLDAVTRKRRMQGLNVLYPLGWDAFGLPAENYAIKTGIHPSITTKKNIANAKAEAISWGLSFDWDREINTTDPEYYKWTQWIFIQLFKKGLAYKAEIAVNWCPSCKINLANEEVIDGDCERCGAVTERRKQSQWILKITAYADRLLEDLKTVNYREDIAAQQINWIGRKIGRKIKFGEIDVFTTKPETITGATFVVISPEHELAVKLAKSNAKVADYLSDVKNKADRERLLGAGKTGVDTGMKVKNPVTGEEIPVWVADYVMAGTGTGAIMGVPAGDVRDLEFAKRFNLEVRQYDIYRDSIGEEMTTYHLRDWVFSRQHYWGEPLPVVYCPDCASKGKSWFTEHQGANEKFEILNLKFENDYMVGWFPVSEADLPVKLPEVEKYQPTETGESPLAHIDEFVNTSCPNCGGKARRETDTMPNWAGSSWYFLRYIDPVNSGVIASMDKMKYWLPVDWYNGGMEHTTLHLLYSRFWTKFLFDLGVVPVSEPYAKRTSHGVILGTDGRKMSKSKGNVINPDEVVAKYGADALRLYEMFIGPFEQTVAWSWESLEGTYRFLKRVWSLVISLQSLTITSSEAKNRMAKLAQKIDSDLENMKFNTAVAAMMEFVNWWTDHKEEVGEDLVGIFLKILAPMAPFTAEELWSKYSDESIHKQDWPRLEVNNENEKVKIAILVDGKVRGSIIDSVNAEQDALTLDNVRKYTDGKKYKVVYAPGKIINFVTAHARE